MKTSIQAALCSALALGLAACAPAATTERGRYVDVNIVSVNDFHGNLQPQSFRVPDPANRAATVTVQAGGIEALSTLVQQEKAKNPNTIFVGGGDLVGASPLASSLLRDEPTLRAMADIGMETSVVGNHEFDYGLKELLRLQNGGCDSNEAARACKFIEGAYPGAGFKYIAANVIDVSTGQPAFAPYFIRRVGPVRVAFVGAVTKSTPTIVVPSGVAGLRFEDEADAINRVIPELKAQGVEAIVALVHEGGTSRNQFDEIDCDTLSGPIVDITRRLDPAVDAVISGHTHQGYQCRVDGRLVVQGNAFGRLLTGVNLRVDRLSRDVVATSSRNIVVNAATTPKDPRMTEIITRAKALTDPVANQPIARLAVEQISRAANSAGESPLGRVIADSQLAATRAADRGGAVIAFMNPGGIRADLPANVPNPERRVTYGDAFTVQPFGNSLVVLTLSGAQIKGVLEQQFDNPSAGQNRILQVSQGFAYTWDNARAKGDKVTSVTLNGQPLDPNASYRVTVNNFLADGGDGFTVLREGTNRLGGEVDLDALTAYLRAAEAAGQPLTPPDAARITRVN